MHDDTSEGLQRSLTATLAYIMGRASVSALYGLQASLSALASQLAPGDAGRCAALAQMPDALRQQMAELARQTALMRAQETQASRALAPYRQQGSGGAYASH